MAERVKRPYDSSRRQEQARQTRRAVLAAAHDLFVSQGYARTTIAEVASAAGVSVETVYAAFRNKPALLQRVWDVTVGGDDREVLLHERPEVQAIRAEADLTKRLHAQARFSTATARRIGPFMRALEAAAGADAAAAAILADVHRQRYDGIGVMAREAAATGQLAVSEQVCHDLVWATTDSTLWHRLVVERGWTDEQYAAHLGATWVAWLVRPGRARAARRG
ncbi:MAG TPA: helix-turn-helix domain-containing protein [Mycobacteriales bacterium]|nr:helix-turn-helix domain-containing protein [Mycobacteriales bacterium]